MSGDEYRNKELELSRTNGECHKALLQYLEKNNQPASIHDPEYHRLRDEYASSFRAWIDFSERHSTRRIDPAG